MSTGIVIVQALSRLLYTEISWVQLSANHGRHLLAVALILRFFQVPFPQCSLSLRCRGCVVDVSAGAGHPQLVVLCILISRISTMVSAYCKKNLL